MSSFCVIWCLVLPWEICNWVYKLSMELCNPVIDCKCTHSHPHHHEHPISPSSLSLKWSSTSNHLTSGRRQQRTFESKCAKAPCECIHCNHLQSTIYNANLSILLQLAYLQKQELVTTELLLSKTGLLIDLSPSNQGVHVHVNKLLLVG